jgi:hypothetical protein
MPRKANKKPKAPKVKKARKGRRRTYVPKAKAQKKEKETKNIAKVIINNPYNIHAEQQHAQYVPEIVKQAEFLTHSLNAQREKREHDLRKMQDNLNELISKEKPKPQTNKQSVLGAVGSVGKNALGLATTAGLKTLGVTVLGGINMLKKAGSVGYRLLKKLPPRTPTEPQIPATRQPANIQPAQLGSFPVDPSVPANVQPRRPVIPPPAHAEDIYNDELIARQLGPRNVYAGDVNPEEPLIEDVSFVEPVPPVQPDNRVRQLRPSPVLHEDIQPQSILPVVSAEHPTHEQQAEANRDQERFELDMARTAITKKKENYDKENEELRKKYEQEKADIIESYNEEIANLRKQLKESGDDEYRRIIAEHEKEKQAKLKEAVARFLKVGQEQRVNYEQQLAKMKFDLNAQFEKEKAQSSAHMKAVLDTHNKTVQEHTERLQKQQQELTQKQQQNDALLKHLADVRSELTSEIEREKQKSKKREEDLLAEKDKEVAMTKVKTEQDKDLEHLQNEFDKLFETYKTGKTFSMTGDSWHNYMVKIMPQLGIPKPEGGKKYTNKFIEQQLMHNQKLQEKSREFFEGVKQNIVKKHPKFAVLFPQPVAGSDMPSAGSDVQGKGKESNGDGLFDDQIETVMKKVPDFIGVWARDEIIPELVPRVHPHTRVGWIMNTDKHNQPGSHWVAILADGRKNGSHSIEYFDPLADEMKPDVQHALKQIADKIDPDMMMKLKVNHVKHQLDTTDTCGYHSMNFLIDRIQRGKSFPEASGFSDRIENKAGKYEHQIEELKKVPPFSYINYQNGAGVIDKIKEYGSRFIEAIKGPRSGAPPEVRNFIASHPQGKITDIKVHRDPISAGITKVGNLITGGKLEEAKKELKYDNLFHLYMTFKVDGKPMLLEKNEVVRLKSGSRNSGETISISTPSGLTVEKFFEKGVHKMGSKFWSYDVANNNCQDFISNILSANHINSSSANTFIKQDAKAIIKKLPKYAHKFANLLTNLASRADIIRNGKGRSILQQFKAIKARLREMKYKK